MKILYKSAEKEKDLIEAGCVLRIGGEVVSAAGFEVETISRRLSREGEIPTERGTCWKKNDRV
jgi:hypothetical protein